MMFLVVIACVSAMYRGRKRCHMRTKDIHAALTAMIVVVGSIPAGVVKIFISEGDTASCS